MSLVKPWFFLSFSALLLASCGWNPPGKPDEHEHWKPTSEIMDFDELYSVNCRGCHSIGGGSAPSIAMNSPIYLASVPPDTLKSLIVNGVPGTAMPSFAVENGGMLTNAQIDLLVKTLYERYQKTDALAGSQVPPYSAPLGDPAAGANAFQVHCASCHGADGKGKPNGSVVDPDYLSLVSDQYLRSVIIAGRMDLSPPMPDWRGTDGKNPLTNTEISDIVAWLSAQRPKKGVSTYSTVVPPQPTSTPANP